MTAEDSTPGTVVCQGANEAWRAAAREMLEAEEAYRRAPTLEHTSRLSRARRRLDDAIAEEPA